MASFAPAEILTIQGLVFMICGALAYHESGMSAKAMSAIYMGNGGAVVSFLLAAGVRDLTIKKGESGYVIMMIAVHLAFVFPLLFGGVISWRLWLAWNVEAKRYMRPFLGIMIVMCAITALVVYANKPKKEKVEKKDEKKEEGEDSKKEEKTEGSSSGVKTSSGEVTQRKGVAESS